MATASALLVGWQYQIKDGDFADEVVTIIDNKPVPDGEPNQRRVLVEAPDGTQHYFLPRQIKDAPVGIAGQTSVNEAAAATLSAALLTPAPVQAEPAIVTQTIMTPQGQQTVLTITPITDPMDSRLDHLRPSRRKVRQYIGREMANGMSDTDFLLLFTSDEYRTDSNNAGRPASVLLKGDTQSGKTMLVEVLACLWSDRLAAEQRERGEVVTFTKPMPVFTISGSAGITDFDLFGQTTSYTDPLTGESSLVWLPGMVELAAQCGGILYLDEVNAIDPRFTSSLHPLADHRHMFVNRNKAVYRGGQFMAEVTSAALDLWIIGTYNEGYAGVGKINEAFVNRFEHVVWGYHGDVESKLIKSAAIRLLGDALRTARERNSIRTPCGTAALQRCERNVRVMGPVVGLSLLTAMFGPAERPIVESIIEDRSVIILLNEELRQAAAEAATRTP